MAICSLCLNGLQKRQVLRVFFNGNAVLVCPKCGAKLKQNKSKMLPYYITVVGVAGLLGVVLAAGRVKSEFLFLLLAGWVFIAAIWFVRTARFQKNI